MLTVLLSDVFNGLHFFMRYLHVFFAIIWIGHLYYFNFVQGAFFNETDAGTKSNAIQKLVPRALWWFRYGALYTFLTGLIMLMLKAHTDMSAAGSQVFYGPYWISILTGAFLATLMFLNVWLIIWPNQKVVIANAVQTAGGGAANPAAAGSGARAAVASRTNVLFSIPMLYFMLSASHLPYNVNEHSLISLYWIVVTLLVGGLQVNAMVGKTGPMTTIKGVITCGFGLTVLFILLNQIFI